MGILDPRPFRDGNVPAAPEHARLDKVSFRTCPGSDLTVRPVAFADGASTLDAHGVPEKGWWSVESQGLPTRTMRLIRGTFSLSELLRRYGFQDRSGCVNHRDAVAHYVPSTVALPHAPPAAVPPHLRRANGVPQFYANSGVCWFAALCTTTFANPTVARMLTERMPPDLREAADRCLEDRDAAQALRNGMWTQFAIGDNIALPPHMDGRNGCSEFSVLCAKLGVPMLRFREERGRLVPITSNVTDRAGKQFHVPRPKPHLLHFLLLRFEDGDHRKFPAHRRLYLHGRRYRLVGFYLGNRKCGHQIGIGCPTGDWRHWVIGDADHHKSGICMQHICFPDSMRDDWWAMWDRLVHVTKFAGGDFCSITPHNAPDDALDQYRGSRVAGSCCVDMVYIPAEYPTGARTVIG